jgi:hypothetical protein
MEHQKLWIRLRRINMCASICLNILTSTGSGFSLAKRNFKLGTKSLWSNKYLDMGF